MDILFHTDEVLELRSRHWRIFMIMGFTFAIAGIVMFIYFGQTTSLECIRERGPYPTCILTQNLIGYTLREKAVEDLMYARVVESQDSDGDITYRIMLDTRLGDVPLTSYFSSGKQEKVDGASEINAFLENKEMKTLSTRQGGKNFFLMSLIFTIIGLLEMLVGGMGRYNIWQLNKAEGLITHRRIGLSGIKVTQFALNEVTGAEVSSSRDSEGDTTYRIELTTNSGEFIPMTAWYSSGHKKKYQAVMLIREFLGDIGFTS